MKLIIGLGNIGPEYAATRHNIGFMVLDHAIEEFGLTWQEKAKFKAHIAEIRIGAEKVLFAKPTTFYNLSGETAQALADFYKLQLEDILVVHDELALPFGTLRTRLGGSDAGNNGVKHITLRLDQAYARIRIGIANPQLDQQPAETFVLAKFSPGEQTQLKAITGSAVQFIEDFIHEDKEFLHTSIRIPKEKPPGRGLWDVTG